ncbi:LemA family protein [Sphingomonas ginsenosidivorax]|uniref:LemA family protein n=1 Tax=Sphingomonas ginsenosidivorax TaxID=862135 RepID=A0A5C6UI01_9SPHN|nr:LemA family protein [Sphingomonas ginsenosidivorax]TXC71695.1 LemA family protein [Sphingomonas ginsenosidivorax]
MHKSLVRVSTVLAATTMLAGCGINSIPTQEEAAKARWADVQNEYQRRSDLIPNLVATVKGYAAQESKVLISVSEARARAGSVRLSGDDLTDPAKVQNYANAQNGLTVALSQLRPLQEQYPDLKSNANFLALQSQLEGTENRITIARRDYNGAVQSYNTTIRTFPAAVGAKIFYGAKPMVPFQATTPGAETAPSVSFGNAS